jgi:CheY-like chemotaxis protein
MYRIDFNKLRFLICDDNPHMRRILRTLLHSFGAREAYEAEDGATALEMYSHYVPDIVITDWSMPIFDGLELAQMIRQPESKGNPYAPIIMLTGHSEKRRVTVARDAGVTEFLAKPISAKGLYQRILNVVANPRPFIKTKTAGATPATPISAPSAASAAKWKSCSSRRCWTRRDPAFSARAMSRRSPWRKKSPAGCRSRASAIIT